MTDRTSIDELERRAEEERARIRHTAEQLSSRLTPGQLIDETLNYARGDVTTLLHNFKGQARDNPMALAMVGAGLAWLMAGQGYHDGHDSRAAHGGSGRAAGDDYDSAAEAYARTGYPPGVGAPTGSEDGKGLCERMSDSAARARQAASATSEDVSQKASEAWHSASDRTSGMAHSAADTARHASEGVRHAAADMRDGASRYARRGGDMFAELLEREPLVIGAIGLAVGAAIGAGLPSTRYEDEYLGPTRDDLKDGAQDAVKKGASKARKSASRAAGKAAEAARSEADRQGLTPGDKTLAEKGASVAKAAKEAAQDEMSPATKSRPAGAKAGSRTGGAETGRSAPGTSGGSQSR